MLDLTNISGFLRFIWRQRLALLILVFFAAAVVSSEADPTVIYVTQSGGSVSGGWASSISASTFQSSLAGAASGTVFYVAKGTYQPDANTAFILRSGVKVYGGFAGTETGTQMQMLAARDIASNQTILKGNGSSVVSCDSAAVGTVIDGFSITEGAGTKSGAQYHGGGIYSKNSSLAVRNCFFYDNTAATNGGGIYFSNALEDTPSVENCTFYNNSARDGGAIYNVSGTQTITNCTFSNNSATASGGAYMFLIPKL